MKKAASPFHLPLRYISVALAVVCCFAALAAGQSICQGTINNQDYDISPLSEYQQRTTWDNFVATYTPCISSTCSTTANVAVCQRVSGSTAGGWPLGDYTGVQWRPSTRIGNEKGFQLLFTANSGTVKTTIEFICDPNFASVGSMVPGPSGAEPTFNNFFFDWKTVHACPLKAPGGGGGDDDGGLAGGWIFIIVLCCVTVVYFVAGFAFNKWYRKEEGITNQIPQYEFWVSLPGLVKDGCVYSYNKVMALAGRGGQTEYLG